MMKEAVDKVSEKFFESERQLREEMEKKLSTDLKIKEVGFFLLQKFVCIYKEIKIGVVWKQDQISKNYENERLKYEKQIQELKVPYDIMITIDA